MDFLYFSEFSSDDASSRFDCVLSSRDPEVNTDDKDNGYRGASKPDIPAKAAYRSHIPVKKRRRVSNKRAIAAIDSFLADLLGSDSDFSDDSRAE